jgi:hypothetical protein
VLRFAIIISSATIVGLTAMPKEAKAWGKFGHLTICELAYRNLTPASRTAIGHIMQPQSGGITVPAHGQTQAQHYTAFNRGCLEEDELPRRNPDDHFINLPRSQSAITDDQCPANVAQGECILLGIRRDVATLRDPSRSRMERAFALFELGHFVGDVHQPLHVSFADDKGGNGIDARVTGGCGHFGYRAENLHGVWDNCILHSGTFGRVYQRADYKNTWSRFTVIYRAADTLQANTSLPAEQQIVTGEPWQWAEESYRITLDPAVRYCIKVAGNCNYSTTAATKGHNTPNRVEQLNQAYLQQYDRVVEDRVRFAGFRLAHLLNQALDPTYSGPVRDPSQPQ